MMRHLTLLPACCLIVLVGTTTAADSEVMPARQSLSGVWRFQLDPENHGEDEQWYVGTLPEKFQLPGTTDENKFGRKTNEQLWRHLSRVYHYVGRAWYQRDVDIPESWQGKRIRLHLERTKVSRVWVDSQTFGTQEGLSAPQVYDLTKAIILTKKIDEEKARRAHLGSQAEAAAAEAIIAMVAKDHGITVRELRNRRRYSHLCAARYEAYHRLRQMDMTLKRIGLVMGGRDHATILYGLRQAGAA